MARLSAALASLVLCAPMAMAQDGFAVQDLTTLDFDISGFSSGGKGFDALPKTQSLMVACLDCDHTAVVNVTLEAIPPEEADREAQLRSGTLTRDILIEGCKAAENITCFDADIIEMGGAIGWVTRTQSGEDRHLQTYAIFKGSEKLNMQAIAETREEADQIGQEALETILPGIVMGPDKG